VRVYVAGHRGMVGSAVCRAFLAEQSKTGNRIELLTRPRSELDLTNQKAVATFMADERPDCVVLAAARVGGIYANNTYPADFIYDNLMMECNVIHQGFLAGIKSLLFLGSSCIYPKGITQPMSENALLTSPLEPTNEPYAIAKIAGIKLCESYYRQHGADFRSVMPTNLYGTGDNFHPENSHVIPALMRRFHEAREAGASEVVIWGTGTPKREFLHVDDLARACLHILSLSTDDYWDAVAPMQSHINVGTGKDCTILELAQTIAQVTGFKGDIVFDDSKPDGTMRKVMDVSLINRLGWRAQVGLRKGLEQTYEWFISKHDDIRT